MAKIYLFVDPHNSESISKVYVHLYMYIPGVVLWQGQKMIQDAATRIAQCEREHGIDTSVEDSLNELKFGLVEVVYEWANGMVRVATVLNIILLTILYIFSPW